MQDVFPCHTNPGSKDTQVQVQKRKIHKCIFNRILKKVNKASGHLFSFIYRIIHSSSCCPSHIICLGAEQRASSKYRSGVFAEGEELLVWTWVDGGIKRIRSKEPTAKPSLEGSTPGRWAEGSSVSRKQVIIGSSVNRLAKLLPGDSIVIAKVIITKYQNDFASCLNISLIPCIIDVHNSLIGKHAITFNMKS